MNSIFIQKREKPISLGWKVILNDCMSVVNDDKQDCYPLVTNTSKNVNNNNTCQQNLILFCVPRTSVDKLSSTFYADFRYVNRIFLSGRVSKIEGNLNVQNSTLCAHETGRNFPLKCRGL